MANHTVGRFDMRSGPEVPAGTPDAGGISVGSSAMTGQGAGGHGDMDGGEWAGLKGGPEGFSQL